MTTIEPTPSDPPPEKLRWYQYRLSSLLWLMLAVNIVMSLVAWQMQRAAKLRELPQGLRAGPDYNFYREDQHIESVICWDGNGRFYYGICLGYVDFDPDLPVPPPSYKCDSLYDDSHEHELLVDGEKVGPSRRGRLLALSPFGRMVEIVLSPDEQRIAEAAYNSTPALENLWEKVVVKRLYRRQGQVQNGRRVGHWTFSDLNGNKAYEGDYLQGNRDGKWTYYHENGKVRAEMMYNKQGRLHGSCKYYNDAGRLIDSVNWDSYPYNFQWIERSDRRDDAQAKTTARLLQISQRRRQTR